MDLCLDNTVAMNCVDKHSSEMVEEKIQELLVDEGNNTSEANIVDSLLKTDSMVNYIGPNFEHSEIVETEVVSVLLQDPQDDSVVEFEVENNGISLEESDCEPDEVDGRLGNHLVESEEIKCYADAYEMQLQQENSYAKGEQTEPCVVGVADCVETCVSSDMVDGCAVTAYHVRDLSDAAVCSKNCNDDENDVSEHDIEIDLDDDEEEDFKEEKIKSPAVAWHSYPGVFQHSDDADVEEKFDDCGFDENFHGFVNPVLNDISEEGNSSVDRISMQDERSRIPASLKEICLLHLNADVRRDSQTSKSSFDEHDATLFGAGNAALEYSSERVDSQEVSVEVISLVSRAHETDEFKRTGDDFVDAHPSIYRAVDDPKPHCDPEHVGTQAVTGLPPVIRDSAPSGDAFKEPQAVIMRTKNKSRRVDSIRKSLIKLGSFGKEHGSGKSKGKKEKDKTKNEAHDKHIKSEPEYSSHGQSGGSASVPVPGSIQQHEQSVVKQNSSDSSIQAPPSSSPTAQRKRISNPLAVDAEKLQIYSAQRQNTMHLMHQQAVQEYERKSEEYLKLPTAQNEAAMNSQATIVSNLKAQLNKKNEFEIMTSNSENSSNALIMAKSSGLDMSPDSACFMEEKRDSLAGLPSSSHALSSSLFQRHKKTDSLGLYPSRLVATKKDSSLTRSHSDSFKKNRKEVGDDSLRQGNSSDDLSNLRMLAARSAIRRQHAEGHRKTDAEHSANSSDSAIDQISPNSDRSSITAPVSLSSSSLNSRREIIAIDDQEFESDEENFNVQGGPFSDFSTLSQHPAHLAVFLHYLILNSDPSPLLFYLITESYPQGSLKEMRKWAYEIFSSFLAEKAPLKIHVDEQTVENIHSTLVNKHDKEDAMRNVFSSLLGSFHPVIADLLADFRCKQALGLGSLYGDHQLTDKLDAAEQAKIIESTLWNHFEKYMKNEDQERNTAMAAALAFLFKHFGYTNTKNNLLLEHCSAFNTKEKTKFPMFSKPSKKAVVNKGHQLVPQQYYSMTYCVLCQNLLCGIGPQGHQCQKCESNFHKICLDNIKEPCSGKKMQRAPPIPVAKPKPQTTNVFGNRMKLIRKQSTNVSSTSTAAAARERVSEENSVGLGSSVRSDVQPEEDTSSSMASHNKALDKGEPSKSADDTRSSPTASRSRSPTDSGSSDDKQVFTYSDVIAEHLKLPPIIRSFENVADPVTSSVHLFSDSDLETEADLPSLDSIISKEQLKRMKPKEKKRQEVINELFYTERAHVRNLKVMHQIFYQPMRTEQSSDLVELLFPNLGEMIEVHSNLNRDFKQKRMESENAVVGDLANVLVSHFSGEKGVRFKNVCATFCEKQSQALELLKLRQRKDPKLAALLQDATANSLCRRLELKDFLPTAMQRLTKYPLLIENLLKYTQADSTEHQLLQLANRSSKEILNHVNKAVQEYENHLKLVEIQKKIDKRPFESSNHRAVLGFKNLDLARHKLLHDGSLTWRLSRDRLINLHVVLLEDILLLLQKQDEKLVLRCQSTLIVAGKEDTKMTHSPIIRLANVLIKPVATDKCAFFLVSTSDVGPQIYDLVAGSKDEKNKWCKRITDAVEAYKLINPTKENANPSKSLPVTTSALLKNAAEDSEVISHTHESDVTVADETVVCCREDIGQDAHDIAINDENLQSDSQEIAAAEEVAHLDSSSSYFLDQIQELDDSIRRSLLQKRDLLSKLGHLPEEDSDFVLDLPSLSGPVKNSDPRDLLLSMVTLSDYVAQHVSSLLKTDEPVTVSEALLEEELPPVPPRSLVLPQTEASPPPLPPRLYRTSPKLPVLQLTDYCTWMSGRLSYLMRCFEKVEEEKNQLVGLLRIAQEEFDICVNENEVEDDHLTEPIVTEPPDSLTCETKRVDEFSVCQEFTVQTNSEEQDDANVLAKEDVDISFESGDNCVLETCSITTIENITKIADDDHTKDSEVSVTTVSETRINDCVF